MANSNVHSATRFNGRNLDKLSAKDGQSILKQVNANIGAQYDDAINYALLAVTGIESEGNIVVADDHGEGHSASYIGERAIRLTRRRAEDQARGVASSLPLVAFAAHRDQDPFEKTAKGNLRKAVKSLQAEFKTLAAENGIELTKKLKVKDEGKGAELITEILARLSDWTPPQSGNTPGAQGKKAPVTVKVKSDKSVSFTFRKGTKKGTKTAYLKAIVAAANAEIEAL